MAEPSVHGRIHSVFRKVPRPRLLPRSQGSCSGGFLEARLNCESMSTLITQCAQRFSEPEQVFGVRTTRPNRRSNLPRYIFIRRLAKEGFIILSGNVNKPLTMTAVVERQRCGESQIAILLPYIQMLEHLR